LHRTVYILRCQLLYIAGRGARFKGDALKQRVHRLKQQKIDVRQRICFDGLDSNVALRSWAAWSKRCKIMQRSSQALMGREQH